MPSGSMVLHSAKLLLARTPVAGVEAKFIAATRAQAMQKRSRSCRPEARSQEAREARIPSMASRGTEHKEALRRCCKQQVPYVCGESCQSSNHDFRVSGGCIANSYCWQVEQRSLVKSDARLEMNWLLAWLARPSPDVAQAKGGQSDSRCYSWLPADSIPRDKQTTAQGEKKKSHSGHFPGARNRRTDKGIFPLLQDSTELEAAARGCEASKDSHVKSQPRQLRNKATRHIHQSLCDDSRFDSRDPFNLGQPLDTPFPLDVTTCPALISPATVSPSGQGPIPHLADLMSPVQTDAFSMASNMLPSRGEETLSVRRSHWLNLIVRRSGFQDEGGGVE
ncbi:hypothetical protein TgHK011_000108 [Trichoderma gracile]|nr:hypothetical protein TgHK011_000108 [Trichoderma gracile]